MDVTIFAAGRSWRFEINEDLFRMVRNDPEAMAAFVGREIAAGLVAARQALEKRSMEKDSK